MFIGLIDHTVHIRTRELRLSNVFSQTVAFLDISSQNCAKASQIHVFQNIAKLKSITMHMISDFTHFDTVAFRQKEKNAI